MQQKELTAQVDSSFFTRFVDFSTGNAYNENGTEGVIPLVRLAPKIRN